MPYQSILQNIAKHIVLNDEETIFFTSLLKEKRVEKKEFILREKQLCKEINFVESGALRAYYKDSSGKESTIMFAVAGWWITDMFCFLNQQPAMLTIEAIEKSCILQLQKDDLDNLYESIPKLERFFRIIMQNAYVREQVRVVQNLALSAEERYDIFLDKYPAIASQVTQKQIASYLGVTPEFLSVIRRTKIKKRIS